MAQYNKQNNSFLANGTSLFEVVMLADSEGNINTGGGNFSGAAVDAFGRARMSQPLTLIDVSNVGSINPDFDEAVSGTGASSHNINDSSVEMSVSAVGDSVLRRTRRRMSYQPGKSLLMLATFTMAAGQTGLSQKVGYYDDNDGIYFEVSNGTNYIVIRSSVTGSVLETKIAQADWNGDKLNGIAEDSTSGFNLDVEKSQIFFADFEWLGVGSVRCGFVINGQFIIAHTFHHANNITGTYMKSANLNVSYEISASTGFVGSSTMKQICCSVVSEGGYEAVGTEKVAGTSLSGNTTNTANTFVNLVTLRLSDPLAIVVLSSLDVLNIANDDFEWGLFLNATTVTSLTFPSTEGKIEYDVTDTDLSSLGTRIAGGYLGGKTAPVAFGELNWDYQLGTSISGVSDTITLAVRTTTTSKACAGLLKWFEL